ncbi:hypothetical protein [Nonomuraea wenchangensis]|uniref:hypothetical protein n=1 Tax=Nonomuraea wenchangensis TaxID=568860 RepID=UPI003F4CC923
MSSHWAGRPDAPPPFAAEHLPFMNPAFEFMTTPALLVAGDKDDSPLSLRGPDWFTDGYHPSPGAKSLLTLFGAEHTLGGVAGHQVAETTDESPERLALLQQLTTAYLRSALTSADLAWPDARAALESAPHELGRGVGGPGPPEGGTAKAFAGATSPCRLPPAGIRYPFEIAEHQDRAALGGVALRHIRALHVLARRQFVLITTAATAVLAPALFRRGREHRDRRAQLQVARLRIAPSRLSLHWSTMRIFDLGRCQIRS